MIRRFHPKEIKAGVDKRTANLSVVPPAQALSVQARNLAQTTRVNARNSLQDIESSLQNASAHLQQFETRVARKSRLRFKSRLANAGAMTLSAMLLVGFFAYQNTSAIKLRVAATQAGINAGLPKYSPAGYGLGAIDSDSGKVSISFQSRTDDKKFTLTQQASSWNSASLLANHISANSKPYQTYQDDGKTVYIYDNSNASWVDGGIWYKVEGNASLNSDQLLRIANSL